MIFWGWMVSLAIACGNTVTFVGTTGVGKQTYSAAAHGKRVQAQCEAKNYAFLLEDAYLESATNAIINSKYECAYKEDTRLGPVTTIKRVKDFEEGIAIMNANPFANGSSIFTQSGYYAREFAMRTDGGMTVTTHWYDEASAKKPMDTWEGTVERN